jgi:acyl-[acyl-carrier-protein]-phospholipid O-acyltransferase / long-chain-fatty-acid--[acyl-carrier-protein] ligase
MHVARNVRASFTLRRRHSTAHEAQGHGGPRRWLRRLLPVRIVGDMPQQGPVLFVAPHRSLLDNLLLSWLLRPQPVLVVSREDLSRGLLRLLLRLTPHLVAETSDPATLRKVLRIVPAGRSLLMYPEGRLVNGPGVMKNYAVPALVAAKAHIPIVPVVLQRQPGRWRWALRVSPAADVSDGAAEAAGNRARRARVTRQVQMLLESAVLDARPRQSVFDAFLDAMRREGRSARIIEDLEETPRSYGELLKGSLAIGRWLDRHCASEERVGLLLPNVIPTVCAILGAMAFRRVPALLNYSAGPVAVRSACVAAQLRTVVTSRAFVARAHLEPLVQALNDVRLLYLEDVRGELGAWDKLWLIAYALRMPRRAARRSGPEDPAVVLFTSGSEDRPKGVVLSHDAIIANIRQIATVTDFTPRDRILNALPVYHSYSFTAGLMLCLLTGTRLFLYISPLHHRAIPEIAYRRDVTGLYGTGTFLSYWGRSADPLDFRTVRYVISGGEKLGSDVLRLYAEKFGLRIFEGYGATECAPVIALSTPQCFRAGTVGRLLPGVEMRLERRPGIPHGGVLHVRGPNLMLGYYLYEHPGELQPPRSAFGPGWYCTGDVVDVEEPENILAVVGRVRRFAKIAGEMVSLDTVEEIAREASPYLQHAAVLRTPPGGGETSVLFTTDAHLTRHALSLAARRLGLQDLAVARQVVYLPELPVLSSGKTDYVTLQSVDLAAAAANDGRLLRAAEPARPYSSDRLRQMPGNTRPS